MGSYHCYIDLHFPNGIKSNIYENWINILKKTKNVREYKKD